MHQSTNNTQSNYQQTLNNQHTSLNKSIDNNSTVNKGFATKRIQHSTKKIQVFNSPTLLARPRLSLTSHNRTSLHTVHHPQLLAQSHSYFPPISFAGAAATASAWNGNMELEGRVCTSSLLAAGFKCWGIGIWSLGWGEINTMDAGPMISSIGPIFFFLNKKGPGHQPKPR